MSADLVKRWRRLALEQERCADDIASGKFSCTADASNLRGYAAALRRCANTAEVAPLGGGYGASFEEEP